MSENKTNKTPSKKTSPHFLPRGMARGCAISFLARRTGETAKARGRTQAGQEEEYIQPDDEKEAGGEA